MTGEGGSGFAEIPRLRFAPLGMTGGVLGMTGGVLGMTGGVLGMTGGVLGMILSVILSGVLRL